VNGTEPKQERDNWIDNRLTPSEEKPNERNSEAGWRRGYAADCKSVKTGSIPVPASKVSLIEPPRSRHVSQRSRSCLVPLHAVSSLLRLRSQGFLPPAPSAVFEHCTNGLTGHSPPKAEPFRRLGVSGIYRLYPLADRRAATSGGRATACLANRLTGR
jgi:hypothetical protein